MSDLHSNTSGAVSDVRPVYTPAYLLNEAGKPAVCEPAAKRFHLVIFSHGSLFVHAHSEPTLEAAIRYAACAVVDGDWAIVECEDKDNLRERTAGKVSPGQEFARIGYPVRHYCPAGSAL